MTKQKNTQDKEPVVYVKKGSDEITDDELKKVVGGAMARGKYSKTIDVQVGYTDVDEAF